VNTDSSNIFLTFETFFLESQAQHVEGSKHLADKNVTTPVVKVSLYTAKWWANVHLCG